MSLVLRLVSALILSTHLPSIRAKEYLLSQTQDWLLMGGYSGVEGEADTEALDTAEVLSLPAAAQYQSEAGWCHAGLAPAPLRLEGATMDWVSVTEHMAAMLTTDPLYTSPHSLVIWDKVLLCGGADKAYVVSPWCWWWGVEDNTWAQGPKMLFARQRAASLQRNGMIWMLGGREGSTILQDNEVLMYPGNYNGTNHKMWMWMHKDMLKQNLWTSNVHQNLKQLPIPLTGHCALMINNDLGLIIGGGTNGLKKNGEINYISEPVPSDHIHFYKFNNNAWISSTVDGAQLNAKTLNRMNVARMNHACIKFNEGGKTKVMVVGGVTESETEEFSVTRVVDILDMSTLTWRRGMELPEVVTGTSLIMVNGRPALVGRYGNENQRKILRYKENDSWENVPAQLVDGRSDYQIVRGIPKTVFFETGDVGVTETFRVRAGNATVPDSERVNTTLTVNTDCGAMDGVTTRSVCCGLETVRYITIQAEGSSAAIKVGKLLVKVALPRCDDSTPLTSLCGPAGGGSPAYDGTKFDTSSASSCP